jgi:tetratricopeptide (TPR) repeat protein
VELNPGSALACNDLAVALAGRGQLAESIIQFQKALEINPDFAEVDYNLGNALAKCGRLDEAITHYRQALKLKPDSVALHYNLGLILLDHGQVDEAIAQFGMALQIKPDFADAHYHLGRALTRQGQIGEAIRQYHQTLKVKPDHAEAWNSLAWLRATYPEASFRDGAEAVKSAQRAAQLTGGRDAPILDTLGAAYAEAGRFPEAVQAARKALDLATQQNNQSLAESIKAKLALYEAGTPFRAMPKSPAAGSTRP